MPDAPKRYCPTCRNLVRKGYCDTCAKRKRQHELRFQKGATAYNSARWVRFSERFRVDHPFCENPDDNPRCTRLSEVVDHVIPHRGDETAFWEGPFRALCKSCHSRKTIQETVI
jgi:5-methylcytosine-specific restriction protein A